MFIKLKEYAFLNLCLFCIVLLISRELISSVVHSGASSFVIQCVKNEAVEIETKVYDFISIYSLIFILRMVIIIFSPTWQDMFINAGVFILYTNFQVLKYYISNSFFYLRIFPEHSPAEEPR